MPSIFLSHNHKDKPFVKRLAAMLISEGINVWVDEAEIGLGESLLEKIETGIREAKFVGAIISPNSINSTWVRRELEMAMTQEINSNKIKVLPIICEKCELPLYLQTKLNADFTDPKNFQISFEKLIMAINEQTPPVLLSAREALIELKGNARGVGGLVGISQQGINQQYIKFINRGNWNYADAKSGRSRTWVAEYFNSNTLKYNSFGICDGQITEYPFLSVQKEHSQKIQVVNFVVIDSVEIIDKAINFSSKQNLNLSSFKDIIILTKMLFDKNAKAFIWRIMFYDIVLVGCIYALDYSAETGELIFEHNMRVEETNEFHAIAKQWIEELTKKGVFKDLDNEVILEITKDYENRIDDIVTMELIDKLEEQNKLDDFDKIGDSSSYETWKYFNDNIPNLKSVVINAIANAKSRIIGNIDRL